MFPDPHSRFSDELNEATMLHTKAIARQDTAGWQNVCRVGSLIAEGKSRIVAKCRIGTPFPYNYDVGKDGQGDSNGWVYNCYINNKTEQFWVPKLESALKKKQDIIFGRN
jgi:hypothetical protein